MDSLLFTLCNVPKGENELCLKLICVPLQYLPNSTVIHSTMFGICWQF